MLDRRRAPRFSTLRSVRIEMNSRWPTIDCVVRNISKQGACVEMSGEFNTTLEYDLVFLTAGEHRRCRQVWRRADRMGVEFADAS